MDPMRCAALSVAASVVLGCAADEGPLRAEVDFRVVTAADDEPFAGGSSLVVALEGASQETVDAIDFPADATGGRAPPVPDGMGYRFRVDVLSLDGIVLARGRSFPFSVAGAEPPPERPDVLLATLGRFVTPTEDPPPDTDVAAVAPQGGGALVATGAGTLYEYRAHDPTRGGEAALRVVGAAPDRRGGAWVDLGEGLLLGVGGVRGGASLHDASGAALASLPAEVLAPQRHGAAVAAVPGARAALVVGGAPAAAGAPTGRVLRLDATREGDGWALLAEELPRTLSTPRRGARAIGVPVEDAAADCPCARVLVVGGEGDAGRLSTMELVDPEGRELTVQSALGSALRYAAVGLVDTGLVLVAGGQGADGLPVADVRAVDVRPGSAQVVSPAPPPLLTPRSSATVARFGDGLSLVIGGVGADGAPLASAELYDFVEDRFGVAAVTGSLPRAQGDPRAAALADGSVLSADASGVAVYAPPRGPGLSAAGTGAAP